MQCMKAQQNQTYMHYREIQLTSDWLLRCVWHSSPCTLLFLLSSSCHPPYPLCPGNFSRLRKLAKLFPFSKLCLKLWELAGLDCLAQALLSLPHSSRGNLANSIIHMHFILIDLIRYLWRAATCKLCWHSPLS